MSLHKGFLTQFESPLCVDPESLLGELALHDTVQMAIGDKVDDAKDLLPSGPYFLCPLYLHQAWRVYYDYLDACFITVIPKSPTDITEFSFHPKSHTNAANRLHADHSMCSKQSPKMDPTKT